MTEVMRHSQRRPGAVAPPVPDAAAVAALERDADTRADAALAGRSRAGPDLAGPGLRRPTMAGGEGFSGLGAGKRLPPALDRRLSQSFGLDLSHLRLHDDGKAQRIAESVGAEAAIAANDIVLGADAGRPDTPEGAATLAHEVAHYAQAADTPGLPQVQRKDGKGGSGVGRAPPKVDFVQGSGLAPEDRAVTFDFDSATLTGDARASLIAWAKTQSGAVEIDLFGYASTEGPGTYNVNLSAHRAVAVQRLLQPLLPKATFRIHAHGEIGFFDPPDGNRRVGIDVKEPVAATASPAQVPGLPKPQAPPAVSLGLPPLTLGNGLQDPPGQAAGPVPSPDPEPGAELPPPLPRVPTQFRIPLRDPITLGPDLAGSFFKFPALGSSSPGQIDYLPLARSAYARGLSLIDLNGRGELEGVYALHRQIYPWIPESSDQVDIWILSKIVGAFTAQAATQRTFDAHLAREYPGTGEKMEREAQIYRVTHGLPEPIVIPPITVFELQFDIGLGKVSF